MRAHRTLRSVLSALSVVEAVRSRVDTAVSGVVFGTCVERVLGDLKTVRSVVEKWNCEGLVGPYDHTERREKGRRGPAADRARAVGRAGPSHHCSDDAFVAYNCCASRSATGAYASV